MASQELLTKLEKLLISEVSGVDDPANELPGWMVMKAKEASPTHAATQEGAAPTLKDRLGLLFGKEDEVTKEELVAILDERDALAKAAAAAEPAVAPVAPAAPAPVEPVAPAAATATTKDAGTEPAAAPAAVAGLTEADVTKAVETAIEPIIEALDKTLDRLAAVESRFVTRKSVAEGDGNGEPVTKNADTVGAAIAGAFGR